MKTLESHTTFAQRQRHAPTALARARNGQRQRPACLYNHSVHCQSANGHSVGPLPADWEHVGQVKHPADEFLQAMRAPHELQQSKVFVFVRHGNSTWNEQSRIQGNTDLSELTAAGRTQAVRARAALQDMIFDSCFSSPHTRARQTTEIVWQPWLYHATMLEPQYLPNLAEVDLGWFQGLRNEDIAREHPELYRVWREEPERFVLDGRHPVLDAFRQSRRAWHDMLAAPGSRHLVITHKSLLRALLCTALGLPPRQFRAIDIANGAICMVRCNTNGDMRFSALNLTSHLLYDNVRYQMPAVDKNDKLAADTTKAPAYTAVAVHAGNGNSSSGLDGSNAGGDSSMADYSS